MAATCGQAATVEGAQLFISPYRSRSRSHRLWLPETILRSVTFGSRQERDRRYMRLQWSKMACAQFDDWGVVYSENGAFATTSAKLGDVYPSTYRTPKSRTMRNFMRKFVGEHTRSISIVADFMVATWTTGCRRNVSSKKTTKAMDKDQMRSEAEIASQI